MPSASRSRSRIHAGSHPSTSQLHRPHILTSRGRRRVAGNFAWLSAAEIACRIISVLVTLQLARRLGTAGYGRVEFAFNITLWLVLLVREGLDVIAAREIARHPRLVRPLVHLVMAIRLTIATALLALLVPAAWLLMPGPTERTLLVLYGLMLLTTAAGIDYVYRGLERMGPVAVSLLLRTMVYALGVSLLVRSSADLLRVPVLLVAGEVSGIALTWSLHARGYGWPRPQWRGGRFLRVFLTRGRSVYAIQVSQAALVTIDLLIVGLGSGWDHVGLYGAAHRMASVALTFGLIFQQVTFPALSRAWRSSNASGREALETLVALLLAAYIPLAVGTTTLAGPLVATLFDRSYAGAAPLLAIEIWRAPLLSLAFLYQAALIARNREASGMRLLAGGAICAVPLIVVLRAVLGLPGAALGAVLTALVLALAGYLRLAREGWQPAWHHFALRPLIASLCMVPVCLVGALAGLGLAIACGAAVYVAVLGLLGGLKPFGIGR
ncbi:MAG: transporter [Isosphaeraceae bacterium]|jgi:O-antigen/teichoic acid export membrane protein|nr:MAG: transporter [Isosphaeraceae bacterium]